MSLQIWMPLINNIKNQGLNTIQFVNSSATITDGGIFGNCYNFAATTGNGIYNQANCAQYMDAHINNHSFSFCAWVKSDSTDTSVCAFSYGLRFFIGNYIQLSLYNTTRTVTCASGAGLGTTDNKWHHVAGTYDVDTGKICVYRDGVCVGTATYPSGSTYASSWSNIIEIGRDPNNNTASDHYYYRGKMSDFRAYDHALSKKEISDISKGLYIHLPMNDAYIEPTTNIVANYDPYTISSTCYNGATGKYGYGEGTDIYRTYGEFQGKYSTKVYMGTDGLAAWPFFFIDYMTPEQNQWRSTSFDYYATETTAINVYSYATQGTVYLKNGNRTASGVSATIGIDKNTWNHIEISIYNNGTSTSGYGYIRIGSSAHTSSTSNYWLVANVQIEDKDHCTPYTKRGTPRNETKMVDCSGFGNNFNINGAMSADSDSPIYNCSTVFNNIRLTLESTCTNIISMSVWVKLDSLTTASLIILCDYSSSFGLGFYTGDKLICASGPSGAYHRPMYAISNFTVGEWNHIAVIKDGVNDSCYINGVKLQLDGTEYWTNAVTGMSIGGRNDGTTLFSGNLSDLRLYCTPLSEKDIMELYQCKCSIDNKGAIHSFMYSEA